MPKLNLSAPDLTQHPPRSVRVRLGGYAHLPRLLDKARAHAAGKAGDYHYNCPMDRTFLDFTGVDQEALLAEVKKGASDSEILAWVQIQTKKSPSEIYAWSNWAEQHGPGGHEGHAWISGVIKEAAPGRKDIRSFSELLDLDDFVSFGGKG
ncbi:MAG TPA: DUF5069 domain-containing protein [Opitutaceae bacterium]|nr:DUF5069 domain-containing protein [Opitutaceae bacterium]